MITSFIEMLELPNFGHVTIPTKCNLNHVINFFCDVMDKNYDVITFILKYLYFKKS